MTHRTADPIEPFTCSACSYAAVTPRAFARHVAQAHPADTVQLRLAAYTDATAGPRGCWQWRGWHSSGGYAVLGIGGRSHRVSRLLLDLTDRHVLALHSCDQPGCVNPAHLRAGSQADNVRDALVRGRWPTVLTEPDVHAIRADARRGATVAELADRTGAHPNTVRALLTGRTWRHLPHRQPGACTQPAGRRAVDGAASAQVRAGSRDDGSREAAEVAA